MKNPFVCLKCSKHILDHTTKTVDCQDPLYQSSRRRHASCAKQFGEARQSLVSDTLSVLQTQNKDTRIREIVSIDSQIKHINKGLFNSEAYRKDQELIRRRDALMHEIANKARDKKNKEENSKKDTLLFLSRIGVSKETALNYSDAYNYVYSCIYNGEPLDEVAISYAIEWNASELFRREKERREVERLNNSTLDIAKLKEIYFDGHLFYLYGRTFDMDEGRELYFGYGISGIEKYELHNQTFAVLVYDVKLFEDTVCNIRSSFHLFNEHCKVLMRRSDSLKYEPIHCYHYIYLSIFFQCINEIPIIDCGVDLRRKGQ